MVVVLPTPLTPTTMTTSGGFTALMVLGALKCRASSARNISLNPEGSLTPALRARGAQLGQEPAGRLETHVGHDQDFLQLFPEVVVHLGVGGQQAVDARGDLLAGLGQAFGELEEQAVALVLLVLQVQGQGQAVLQLGGGIPPLPGSPCPTARS